jgi:predicted PurR-regulated permease PerM
VQLLAPTGQISKLPAAGIAVTGLGAGIALLYFGRTFWITVVISVILAFLLEPFVGLFQRIRVPRKIASFLVCTIGVMCLYLLGAAAFAQLASFADDLPEYSLRINHIVDTVAERLERAEADLYRLLVPRRFQPEPPQQPEPPSQPAKRRRQAAQPPPGPPPVQEIRIHEDRPTVLNYVAGYVSSAYQTLLMMSFIPFLVYFMLSWREHFQRSILAICGGADRKIAGRSIQAIANMARAYVVGNVILGLLLSLVSCVVFWSWHLPYWIVLGILSGFLSLVPYIGLPLAMIPAFAGALMTYSTVTPYLAILAEVAALHLLALNLLYPAIVGARVHLNPLAVTVALMFWGTIWGAIGLILAIPITAAVKAVLDNNEDLEPYGRLLGD